MNPVLTLAILLAVIGAGDGLLVMLHHWSLRPRTGAVESRLSPPAPPASVRSHRGAA